MDDDQLHSHMFFAFLNVPVPSVSSFTILLRLKNWQISEETETIDYTHDVDNRCLTYLEPPPPPPPPIKR